MFGADCRIIAALDAISVMDTPNEIGNKGLITLVMTDRIFPQMHERVGSGMVLLPGLRTVVCVTAADPCPIATIHEETPKKPIRALKADRR